MSTQTIPDTDDTVMAIEWTGQLAPAEVRQLLDELGEEETIRKLRVELATDQPDGLSSHLLGHQEDAESDNTTEESEQAAASRNAAEPPDETAAEPSETDEESAAPEADEGDETTSVPRLHAGQTPFKLLRILDAKEGWLRTEEIRAAIPDDWDVDADNIGTNLWNLADRNLVEKRPYEDDKRKTEYRITELGQQALDETFDRAEEQDHSDIEPLPDEQLAA